MATFEALPAEVIALIAEYIKADGAKLASFAATSQQCRANIEAVTWQTLQISDSDFADFRRLVTPTRFRALRRLSYKIELQSQEKQDNAFARLSSEQADTYSEHFTDGVITLLSTLRDQSSNDNVHHPGIHLSLWGTCDLGEATYLTSEGRDRVWVRLIENRLPDNLSVPVVTSFQNQGLSDTLFQSVWPQSWVAVLACCPKLRVAVIHISDNERKNVDNRKQARDALGASLPTLPPDLTDLTLLYLGYAPGNHMKSAPVLSDETQGFDIFSHGLGALAARIEQLEVRGATLDLEDFFTSASAQDCPRLEKLLLLEQQPASADGTWYFTLDPRMTMEEYEEDYMDPDVRSLDELRLSLQEDELPAPLDHPTLPFRTATDPLAFKNIYVAAANAVRRMPKLQTFEIWFELLGQSAFDRGEHEIRYTSGQDRWCSSSTAEIKVGWGLVPMIDIDDDVLRAWRGVGDAKGSSIELFTRDQDLDYDDFTLIE